MRHYDSRETELMDRPQPASHELELTLRELETLNRRFGGHRYARRFLARRFRSGKTYRVLDVATGGGDFPRAMVDWARAHQVQLQIDAIDASSAIVRLANQFSTSYPEIRVQVADARHYTSEDAYDLVHCSLSVHHFSAAEAVGLLKRFRALSREYVLVTDLERSVWTSVGVWLATKVFTRGRITIQDGHTSARRAFSFREFRALAKGAAWPPFGHERFLFCRQALWLPGSQRFF